ncbi:hypothetical protein AAC387_Pa08g0894 [Persea americana]
MREERLVREAGIPPERSLLARLRTARRRRRPMSEGMVEEMQFLERSRRRREEEMRFPERSRRRREGREEEMKEGFRWRCSSSQRGVRLCRGDDDDGGIWAEDGSDGEASVKLLVFGRRLGGREVLVPIAKA